MYDTDDSVTQEIGLCQFLKWNIPKEIKDIESEASETDESDEETSVLDNIFPPREWTRKIDKEEITYRQTVSREISLERGDVREMVNQVDKCLEYYNTKKTGIDEMRSAIFKSVFDEMLRQLLVEDEEAGVFLYETYNQLRKLKYIWKVGSEMVEANYVHIFKPFEFDELGLEKKIESLKKTKEDYILKCNLAKLKYNNTLDAKMYNVKCIAISRKNRRAQRTHASQSTRLLEDQLKIMLLPMDHQNND